MRSLNLVKDSHFTLVKGYSMLRSIEDVVGDVESPYIIPRKELSEAQAYLHSDFSVCNKHLKRALKLYQQEVPLARRYNTIRNRVTAADNQEISSKNNQYVEAIRAGRYREAEKVLDEIMKMNLPQIVNHLSAALSQEGKSIVLINSSSTHINVISVSVQDGKNVYGGGFRGKIMPGGSIDVPLNGNVVSKVEVLVTYFVNGKQYKRNIEVGA